MQKIQLFTNYTVVKILLFYKNILGVDKWGLLVVYKKTAFLQKDIFVRKLLFYVKILLFYSQITVKSLPFYKIIYL